MDDIELALQLHKQLNAAPLRARRGHEADAAQPSLERYRRELAAKPRGSKRTNSSSQDQPGGRRRRTSDPDEHGHTSARQRLLKNEATCGWTVLLLYSAAAGRLLMRGGCRVALHTARRQPRVHGTYPPL
jgi:hypothetical protein